MDKKQMLFRQYGTTLERILDLHSIEGDRSIAKNILHKSLKKSKGIAHISHLSNDELEAFIKEINDFFPLPHN